MALTQAMIDELRVTGGKVGKASRNLGVDYLAAAKRFVESKEPVLELGRPELRKYIVAHRLAGSGWNPLQQSRIDDARRKYDAGTHEMCQGRDGRYILLYIIPRLVPCERRYFFQDAPVQ